MSLPAILYVADLRKLLEGWDADRVRRFLTRNDLALVEKPKAKPAPVPIVEPEPTDEPASPDGPKVDKPKKVIEHERTYTTSALLAERMPEAYAAMEAKWAAIRAGAKFNPDHFDDLSEPED